MNTPMDLFCSVGFDDSGIGDFIPSIQIVCMDDNGSEEGSVFFTIERQIGLPSGNGYEYTITASLVPGTYKIKISSNIHEDTGYTFGSYRVILEPGNMVRANQIFHTSFEEEPGAITVATAKTGRKAYSGSYPIYLNGFLSGEYEMSYWKSTDNGANWQLQTSILTVDPSTIVTYLESGQALIDEVRILPRDAQMTTYTYIPGLGVTSIMDPNGQTIYYEYDGFGKQAAIRDNDRNLVESYEYQ